MSVTMSVYSAARANIVSSSLIIRVNRKRLDTTSQRTETWSNELDFVAFGVRADVCARYAPQHEHHDDDICLSTFNNRTSLMTTGRSTSY